MPTNKKISPNTLNPLVSVVIPVYNAEKYLAEAIESVLQQDHQRLEILVIDDGSTDASARVAKMYGDPVHYVYQEHSGIGASRNCGVELASGEYIGHLDADDLWTNEKLALQLSAFAGDPSLEIVSGHVEQFLSPELSEEEASRITRFEGKFSGGSTGASLIHREAYAKVGLYETNWEVGTDMSWYLRANEVGLRILILPETVLLRRIHTTNQGILHREKMVQRVHILKRALDRRRRYESRDISREDRENA